MGEEVSRPRHVLAALATLASGCGAQQLAPWRPSFEPPRRAVFEQPLPVVESPDNDLLPSLSPDAMRLAYAADSGGNLDIFVRTAGGAPERLTTHTTDDTDPAFAPDGEGVAWVSQAEDVKGDLWIMAADGKDKRRLTDRQTADRAPAWSPSGKRIYFTALAPGALHERIDSVDLEGGGRATVVARGWDAVPSPDGEQLPSTALT